MWHIGETGRWAHLGSALLVEVDAGFLDGAHLLEKLLWSKARGERETEEETKVGCLGQDLPRMMRESSSVVRGKMAICRTATSSERQQINRPRPQRE